MIYDWTARFPSSDVDAQKAGEELERIRGDHGGQLRPIDVVNAARAPDSTLHPLFEWNDRKAAEQHRLERARGVLRAVVTIIDTPAEEVTVRAFVSILDDSESARRGRVYVGIDDVRKDPDKWEQVMAMAMGELQGWRDRWQKYEQLRPVVSAVSQAIDKHQQIAV